MSAVQIPFDLPVREAFDAEDFLVTESNKAAVYCLDGWPYPDGGHCMIFHGEKGCGKTHLTHVWQHKVKAKACHLSQIEPAEAPVHLIIEDVEEPLKEEAQQEKLFHLYNIQKQKHGTLMLTARTHPKQWQIALPDLKSRMLASLIVEIGPPDDELLTAVIIKQFMDRQIIIPAEVIAYIIPRIERSFAAAGDIVRRIDRLALSRKRKITIPLVREILEIMGKNT